MIKHVPAAFTLQELMAYLRGEEEGAAPEGYRTTEEWSEHYGVHVATMRQILRDAKKADKLAHQWVKRERLDGIMQRRAVYAFVLPDGSVKGGEAGDLSGDG